MWDTLAEKNWFHEWDTFSVTMLWCVAAAHRLLISRFAQEQYDCPAGLSQRVNHTLSSHAKMPITRWISAVARALSVRSRALASSAAGGGSQPVNAGGSRFAKVPRPLAAARLFDDLPAASHLSVTRLTVAVYATAGLTMQCPRYLFFRRTAHTLR